MLKTSSWVANYHKDQCPIEDLLPRLTAKIIIWLSIIDFWLPVINYWLSGVKPQNLQKRSLYRQVNLVMSHNYEKQGKNGKVAKIVSKWSCFKI